MRLDWTTTTRDRVTLVHLRVTNDAPTRRRVRVTNRLDGPVWPPRQHGNPVDGWDADGFVGEVAPETTLPLGYACPADPPGSGAGTDEAEPPVTVETLADAAGDGQTAESVFADLGDPRPPRDALDSSPDPAPDGGTPAADRAFAPGSNARRDDATPSLPPALADWFDAVADRVTAAERGDLRGDGPALVADREALTAASQRIQRLRSRLVNVERRDPATREVARP